MAGRRAPGRPPAKRAAPAAASGKTASKAAASATASLTSLVRQDQRRGRRAAGVEGHDEEEEEEAVTLLYRKPSTRSTGNQKRAAATSSSNSNSNNVAPLPTASASSGPHHTSTVNASVAVSPESSVLSFFERAAGPVNLAHSLRQCGVDDIQKRDDGVVYHLTQQQLFHCSDDRLETAVQALRNVEALLFTPADTTTASGAPWVGQACWVRPAHVAAVVALARVGEAAVPLHLPPLVQLFVAGTSATPSAMTSWTLPVEVAGGSRVQCPRAAACHDETTGGLELGETSLSHEATVTLVPSPVRLSDVRRRLRCLRRLHQLRVAYSDVMPRLHAAVSLAELCQRLFAHDSAVCRSLGRLCHLWASPDSHPSRKSTDHAKATADVLSSFLGSPAVLDTLLPLVGISARHLQEEALLQHLVGQLKEATAVEAAAWGPMAAAASWRCSDGVYVVQHAARVRALRRLLAEAQFYGLPRFLRSIRAVAAGADTAAGCGVCGEDGWPKGAAAAVQRAQRRYADHFFLTPDVLDPASFAQPDSMQLQLVQEELITLQRSHCAFCLVVGEAEEVVTLLHRHLEVTGQAWQHLVKKEEKREEEEEEEGRREGGSSVKLEEASAADAEGRACVPSAVDRAHSCRPVDPLHRYTLRTVDAARRHEREKKARPTATTSGSGEGPSAAAAAPLPFSHVQWVEGGGTNCWSPNTHYYGLVYMVVLETDEWDTEEVSLMTEGLLPRTAIDVSANEATGSMLRPPRPATYCVNAMVELWRS